LAEIPPIPLLQAGALRPVLSFLSRSGAPIPPRLERVQDLLAEAPLLLPLCFAGRLLEEAAGASGREDLGLRAGESARPEGLGGIGRRLRGAATLSAAIETLVRSVPLYSTGERWWVRIRGSELWLHRSYSPVLRRGRVQANDLILALTLRVLRRAAGPQWRPCEIHLDHSRPGHAGELADLAVRGARFDRPSSAVAFPRRLLSLPLAAPRAPTGGEEPAGLGGRPAADFAGSARQAVASLLRLGVTDLAAAADAAGLSARSLQRRLAEVGLRFGGLLAEARLEAARSLLRDPRRRVIDVSAELGYNDSANFTRAFRRWSGVAPQQFRRSQARTRTPAPRAF
jgi:AraC-like DNA-binding protein